MNRKFSEGKNERESSVQENDVKVLCYHHQERESNKQQRREETKREKKVKGGGKETKESENKQYSSLCRRRIPSTPYIRRRCLALLTLMLQQKTVCY